MGLAIVASDLKYKYPKVTRTRFDAKFSGPDDSAPFNRDDLYDILPLLAAVMDELQRDDAATLHFLEDLMNQDMPRFLVSRGEVFDFLTGCGREMLSYR
ncbi:hypothetical protein KP004_10085 [Geomonas oryzisoli]|uniref:Uncharacterized protein n=1 Tax=Geomonas oryzisoli TaxID=2847992 RepID=A0ABX8JDH1_9BACT|nr:hypothetical protein [Geomonas oryzisoli]QWV95492.1 hypothetical protein KP004_10085 [Geomonas oryzisoli]